MNTPKVFERKTSIITGKSNLQKVWELPQLPFTEFFGKFNPEFPKIDQELMLCPDSGVFQLRYEVDPSFLYHSDNYNFRTLTTPKIQRELDFFVTSSSLKSHLNSDSRILEIGGNNSVMADQISNLFSRYVVCDPIVEDSQNGTVEYWGGLAEDRLDSIEDFQPTVIIGRHVLEHLSSPFSLLDSLLKILRNKVVFIFEFPNFRIMQQRQRFDAVFHQHLNYFDEYSIRMLVDSLGCKILSIQNNLEGSNGGSLVVSFTNDEAAQPRENLDLNPFSGNASENFDSSLKLFQDQTALVEATLKSWKGEKVGFGAGLMLATLNYHLSGEVENLSAIYDDDETKEDVYYQNLNVRIKSANQLLDKEDSLILITSMENQRKVSSRLQAFTRSTILGFQIN